MLERQSTVQRRVDTQFEKMKALHPNNGGLDKYQAQAGDEFERLWYNAHFGVPAMDPSKEPVDGGRHSYEIPDHVIDCNNKLGRLTYAIGLLPSNLLHLIIIEDRQAALIAADFGDTSSRAAQNIKTNFRYALTAAAQHWDMVKTEHRRSSYFNRDFIPKLFEDT